MMRFLILSKEQIIGETDLEMHDPGMNIYSGRFYPFSEYVAVRLIFRSFGPALDRMGDERETALNDYYKAIDNLRLSIQHASRRPLSAN